MARAAGGEFLLRIEDIDGTRSRPEFDAALRADLAWLGLAWPEPAMRQSERMPAYLAALERLRAMGLVYPCTCTRRDIAAALAAPQEGGTPAVYPGTCRGRRDAPEGAAWRLDLGAAVARLGGVELSFCESGREHAVDAAALRRELGDVVLGRKDVGAAYHLAVVVDDAAQGVTHVARGADLLAVTPLHRLLQAVLGLPAPGYHHHRLIRDDAGRRLAKRDDARSLATLRAEGATPEDVRRMVGLTR
jgi:glutamyl-Q tRNA(Asp) synthetase